LEQFDPLTYPAGNENCLAAAKIYRARAQYVATLHVRDKPNVPKFLTSEERTQYRTADQLYMLAMYQHEQWVMAVDKMKEQKKQLTISGLRGDRTFSKDILETFYAPAAVGSKFSPLLFDRDMSRASLEQMNALFKASKIDEKDKDGDVGMSQMHILPFQVAPSKIHGVGLFATKPIKNGDVLYIDRPWCWVPVGAVGEGGRCGWCGAWPAKSSDANKDTLLSYSCTTCRTFFACSNECMELAQQSFHAGQCEKTVGNSEEGTTIKLAV